MDTVTLRNHLLTRVYGWMTVSLIISFLSASTFARTQLAYAFVGNGIQSDVIWLILLGVEFYLIYRVRNLAMRNPTLGGIALLGFSVFDGATLAGMFALYSPKLIANAFLISAVTFGAMSTTGVVIKKNMRTLRKQLIGAFIALMVVWLIELFLQSPMVLFIFSGVGVVIFSLLIMVDTNRIVRLANDADDEIIPSLAIVGAMELYLDFINLFVDILNLIGFTNRN